MSRKVSESQKKEIVRMFDNGTNIKEISKELNFTIQTITRQLKLLLGKDLYLEKKNTFTEKCESKELKNITIDKNKDSDINISKRVEFFSGNNINNNEKLAVDNIGERFSSDPLFVELTPINHNFDEESRKEISTTPLKSFDFPAIVYMIIAKETELETKLLKEYPDWQFLPKEDLDRESIELFLDIKKAKRICKKEQKVLKVPNTDVFKIVAPILLSRGISRIVLHDTLISL